MHIQTQSALGAKGQSVKYLKHSEIDFQKWDKRLSQSAFRHPTLESWYLNVVAPNWSAVVVDDYEICTPFFIQTKWGISYASKPPFVQQLGNITTNSNKCFQALDHLPKRVMLVESPGNETERDTEQFPLYNNYCLSLKESYETLRASFNSNTKRNINKAKKAEVQVSLCDDVEFVFQFFKSYNQKNGLSEAHLNVLKRLLKEGFQNAKVKCYIAKNTSAEPLAMALITSAFNRHVYTLATSSESGMRQNAMFAIVDSIIKEHCETDNALLDFEGSNIEGVARFYKGFGAMNRPYPFYKINKLSWPISLFKG